MRIIQIIPADGWFAQMIDKEKGKNDEVEPLACWALLDNGEVHGMISDGDHPKFADSYRRFGHYFCDRKPIETIETNKT